MKKLYKYIIVICLSAVYIAISDLALPLSELAYGTGCCTVTGRYLPVAVDGPPWVIAIDPGHGGTDTGALAITAEYKVIDTTASFLYGLLDDDKDFIPVYTRTDTDPSSRDRAAAAFRCRRNDSATDRIADTGMEGLSGHLIFSLAANPCPQNRHLTI